MSATPEAALRPLKAELPDHLFWLTPYLQAQVRQAAFFTEVQDKHAEAAPLGGTRCWGEPDLPRDAAWARTPPAGTRGSWNQCPRDGESWWLQLNMAEVPAEVRRPEWPTQGVVWVFIDLSEDGARATRVEFDPRPAQSIPWLPRPVGQKPRPARWVLADTLPDVTEETLPQVEPNPEMTDEVNEWVQKHYQDKLPEADSQGQVGGWCWPRQGDFDLRNPTYVCGLEGQAFGDDGAVYLHFSPDKGFWAIVDL